MLSFLYNVLDQFLALPSGVLTWVVWMGAVFTAALLFVSTRKTARFALLTFYGFTFVGSSIAIWFTGSIHWIGLVHLIFWPPLLFHLIKNEIRDASFKPKSIYGSWVILLIITMIVSLVFDLRDVVLLFQGNN
ncbi:MAG: hypothetical protein COB78_11970 [Hyphomicrobiales bacterium]|nr:MAG: hypothetical protein COB78_11970 [Hyphomicrobiales bacterium]